LNSELIPSMEKKIKWVDPTLDLRIFTSGGHSFWI
jgi:hypothetical protein